jgi:hypothetical protein
MTQVLLIGVGAGAAAALLFASVISGVGLSIILFYLAPLPITIVALGWSHWAGLTAALTAAAMLGGAFGPLFLAMFLTSIGVPAWWLGYLALLGRPIANGGAAQMEWYPPGRLVLWAAFIGATVTAVGLATLGGDEATIRQSLKGALDQVLHFQTAAPGDNVQQLPGAPAEEVPLPEPQIRGSERPAPQVSAPPAGGTEETERVVDLLVQILPPAAAVITALTQIANLWLGGLVVRLSGRLRRPWPDLTAVSFPPLAAGLYGALLAAALLLPGAPGIVASLFAATLTMAFAMAGFAFLHAATRHRRGRVAILLGAYGCVLLVWPLVVMTIIGVAETLFDLRKRFARPGPPARPDT